MRLRDIPTPALVVDVRAMERNIRRMAEDYREGFFEVQDIFARGPAQNRYHELKKRPAKRNPILN